ncbi:uncharacterized protein PHACADRAFT_251500 [Phanerochaete carnosa HHB-10118-sp]|uniref:DUF6699 domain-containing protein n=1 Tax=Phanerochaete carnosa (strain HHB-10118-sp) TaxID=650164 RepID=K5X4E8_PHACS|nr:uncharacterized protein PHACADRAFT_251500 [Phanerochaete carnosa HHB-10118-sp]EKM57707.1 hypothetical protein PHACADRAFT_251500 [Phanerochaete carnosa HHB-10118-sp]
MHPENWIPRLEHPALPPRPDLWSTPPSTPRSTPPPLPCEMQLNPLLQHRRTGLPMLDYDLRHRDLWVFVGPPQTLPAAGGADALKVPVSLELYGPNGAQPATYPGVGALNVTMLGDEPFAEFHWPFIVLSRHPALPVTVQDVLEAVHENFRQCLTTEEVDMLGPFRRDQLFRTYWARVEWFPSDETAGLRRVDYLGDRYMFRGLEPAPVGDGFMIFFGPQR